jgi:hypothetical protein
MFENLQKQFKENIILKIFAVLFLIFIGVITIMFAYQLSQIYGLSGDLIIIIIFILIFYIYFLLKGSNFLTTQDDYVNYVNDITEECKINGAFGMKLLICSASKNNFESVKGRIIGFTKKKLYANINNISVNVSDSEILKATKTKLKAREEQIKKNAHTVFDKSELYFFLVKPIYKNPIRILLNSLFPKYSIFAFYNYHLESPAFINDIYVNVFTFKRIGMIYYPNDLTLNEYYEDYNIVLDIDRLSVLKLVNKQTELLNNAILMDTELKKIKMIPAQNVEPLKQEVK